MLGIIKRFLLKLKISAVMFDSEINKLTRMAYENLFNYYLEKGVVINSFDLDIKVIELGVLLRKLNDDTGSVTFEEITKAIKELRGILLQYQQDCDFDCSDTLCGKPARLYSGITRELIDSSFHLSKLEYRVLLTYTDIVQGYPKTFKDGSLLSYFYNYYQAMEGKTPSSFNLKGKLFGVFSKYVASNITKPKKEKQVNKTTSYAKSKAKKRLNKQKKGI